MPAVSISPTRINSFFRIKSKAAENVADHKVDNFECNHRLAQPQIGFSMGRSEVDLSSVYVI